MGLHRCRIWRFVLSIALFIAVVQIVTTLYFTSYFNGDGSHESARINGDVKTTPFSDISTSKSVETTAVFDIRKSKVIKGNKFNSGDTNLLKNDENKRSTSLVYLSFFRMAFNLHRPNYHLIYKKLKS